MNIMSKEKYKDAFIDHMMIHELGMETPDEDDSPAKAGVAMFTSFVFFGGIPLYPYIFFALDSSLSSGAQFGIAVAATVFALYLLGMLQVRVVV
jgi:hypothetical protein